MLDTATTAHSLGVLALTYSATITAIALTAVTARTPQRRRDAQRVLRLLLLRRIP